MKKSLDKANVRKQVQKKIDQITFFELIKKSDQLVTNFKNYIFSRILFQDASPKYMVSFYPFDTEPQINIEFEGPHQVGYVRIDDWDQRLMVAAAARRDQPGQWEEISISKQNKIFQPTPQQKTLQEPDILAVLVPGVAFSTEGHRLGRGAGFYDRFLSKYPQALRIGIAFEEQIITGIPTDPWDEKVDIILTDHRVYDVLDAKTLGEAYSQGKVIHR